MLECVAVGKKLCWSAQWKVNVVVKMDFETYQIRIFYLWNRSGSFDWVSAHFLSFPFSSFLLVNPSFTRLNSIVSIHEANSKWYRNCIICRASSPSLEPSAHKIFRSVAVPIRIHKFEIPYQIALALNNSYPCQKFSWNGLVKFCLFHGIA